MSRRGLNRAELLRDVVRGASAMEAAEIASDALGVLATKDTALMREVLSGLAVATAFAALGRERLDDPNT